MRYIIVFSLTALAGCTLGDHSDVFGDASREADNLGGLSWLGGLPTSVGSGGSDGGSGGSGGEALTSSTSVSSVSTSVTSAGSSSSSSGSGGEGGAGGGQGGAGGSLGPCDDGDPCTVDGELCGMCIHHREHCECVTDADCDDGNPHSGEACGPVPGACSSWLEVSCE